jgi:outer membrane protein TolC
MNERLLRVALGVALAALVVAGATPRLVGAQTHAPRTEPTPLPSTTPAPAITLPPASEPTSLPYPAYGTPVPGVNGGVPAANVPPVVTLDQSIAIGYAQSPALAAARANLGISKGALDLAGTPLLPNIAGTASTEHSRAQNAAIAAETGIAAAGSMAFVSNNLQAQLTQLIYDGGKVAANVRAARATLHSTADTYRRQLQTVAFNVATAYYNDLAAQRATAIAVQVVQVDLVNESLVSAQIKVGTEAAADLATAQLQTAEGRLAVVKAQSAEISAHAAFANAMGLDANTLVLPKDNTPVNGAAVTSTVVAPPYDVAIKRALLMRPDVSAGQYTIDSTQASLRAAKLGLFPTLAGNASYGTASSNAAGGDFRNSDNIGASLNVPIFDQGITHAQVEQARGQLDLAVANQNTLIQGVQLNVKQTLTSLVSARQALAEADVELANAQVVLASTQAQYRAGVTTLPLLLNAQEGFAQALTDQSTAVYSLRQAEQAFLFAEGTNANS